MLKIRLAGQSQLPVSKAPLPETCLDFMLGPMQDFQVLVKANQLDYALPYLPDKRKKTSLV